MALRPWVAPAALAAATLVSTAVALQTPDTPDADQAAAAAPPPKAPVLSARRVPELLARSVADARLKTRLDATMRTAGAGPNSCLVVEHEERLLYSRNPERPLIPASNLKVLTAVAVLAELGPEYRFTTTAQSPARIDAQGTLDGTLYLVGAGDPLLMTADYVTSVLHPTLIATPFERLADDLVAKGLRRITKGIQGDETRFDTQRYLPTWRPSYAAEGQVGPQSALLVNDGFGQFKPRRVAVGQPAVHAAQVLTDLLAGRGVSVTGAAGQSQSPAGAATLSELRSPPVREVVAQMLKESDNTTAELLAKELGRRTADKGTTSAGLKAVTDALSEANLPVAQLQAVDASGLDRGNRATCGLLAGALDAAPLHDSMAIAAKDGTLDDRFHGHPAAGRLRAKTGSLQGVVGLTGFMDPAPPNTSTAAPLEFALIANDLPREATGRALQEAVAAALARYPDAPPVDQLDP